MKSFQLLLVSLSILAPGLSRADGLEQASHAQSIQPLVLATHLSLQDDAAQEEQASTESFVAKGAWNTYAFGAVAFGDGDKGELYTAHLGISYYFADKWAIALEPFGGLVDSAVDDNGELVGLDLLFRWHFLTGERFSLHLEGGAGIQQADTDCPSDNHFNFRPQLGLGATVRLTEDFSLLTGVRYLHISNAGITNGNDGFDGAMVYLGAMLKF